ncbi:ester cyclase [Haloglomus halophilum]|uniref:ester cyclase n=1 Tax=Haloglomus halophilum TaxID=2962672 RepID=UPI0020C9F567|nr:ester cyclase [Haloglomus halophilum]
MDAPETTHTTVIERLTDAWNDHDRESMAELYAEELAVPNAEPDTRSRAEQLDAEMAFFESFPDATATIEDLFAAPDGDRVFVRWHVTATHDGNFAGIAPTGNSLSYEEWALYEVADGRITGVRATRDSLEMLEQLDALDWPSEAGEGSW